MRRALELAASARRTTSPNPWVGAVVLPGGYEGCTQPPGGAHAEIEALAAAGGQAQGATMVSTLEPCAHRGRTPPCVEAIAAAGIRRVVVGIEDPDPRVRGRGIRALREMGIDVEVGLLGDDVSCQLAPYLHHRRTGRPLVVLKLAMTLDGRTAAPDGSSRWITGPEARADAHRIRAESDAVLVGAGTLRADDPDLTARGSGGEILHPQPQRVVLGTAPPGARARPLLELSGEPAEVLDQLGARGMLQVMVEGGSRVAGSFHRGGLIDRYVLYVAPALMGGDDGAPVMAGRGAPAMSEIWRGRVASVCQLGPDVRIEVVP